MRCPDYSYDTMKIVGTYYFHQLNQHGLLNNQIFDAYDQYIKEMNSTDGTSNINEQWNNKTCTRYSYKNMITGFVSEAISIGLIGQLFGIDNVDVFQDKQSQSTKKLDFTVKTPDGDITVQSKTAQFKHDKLYVESNWVVGDADYIALTDIDDKECYIVSRDVLFSHAKDYVTKSWLQENSKWSFVNHNLYKLYKGLFDYSSV